MSISQSWFQHSLVLLSLLTPGLVEAGAWVPAPGAVYNKFAINWLDTDRQFDPGTPGFESFRDRNFTYYGEKGVSDGLASFVSIPFKSLRSEENGRQLENSGIADVDIGLRWEHLDGKHVLSTGYLAKLPLFYDEDEALALGNGQLDLEFRLLYGRGISTRLYVGAELAYRARFEAPSDEIRLLLEAGFRATDTWYFRSKLDLIQSVGNGDPQPVGGGNPSLNLEFDLGRIELTTGFRLLANWYAELTATPSLYGENTLDATNYQFALIYSY